MPSPILGDRGGIVPMYGCPAPPAEVPSEVALLEEVERALQNAYATAPDAQELFGEMVRTLAELRGRYQ